MVDKNLINSSVLFVHGSETVEHVVRLMIDHQISSVMVTNHNDELIGIITERDIVRKFTLLAVEDKLERRANTIMTRPVRFVNLDNLYEEIKILHTTTQIRHFPVLVNSNPHKDNLVGMVTPTDLFRQHLNHLTDGYILGSKLCILATDPNEQKKYDQLFTKLGYELEVGNLQDVHLIFEHPSSTLLVDLDGSSIPQISDCLKQVWKHKGQVFLLTSDSQLISPFRKKMDPKKQHIALKPLDVSYINWLIGKEE